MLKKLGADVYGISLEKQNSMLHFYHQRKSSFTTKESLFNILDKNRLREEIKNIQPDLVFHLAAQPLVYESYKNPLETFETNIIGTANVLNSSLLSQKLKGVVSIATDKVYINNNWEWGYRENDPLGADDPYSASKAAQEILTNSFFKSFYEEKGLILASARAGNVFGGGDFSQKRLIPDLFKSFNAAVDLDIRNPGSTRPWIYVLDPLWGYLILGGNILGKNDVSGPWNFGPHANEEVSVKTLLNLFLKSLKSESIFKVNYGTEKLFKESDRLKLDSSKAISQLGWSQAYSLEEGVKATSYWYKNFFSGNCVAEELLVEYFSRAEI